MTARRSSLPLRVFASIVTAASLALAVGWTLAARRDRNLGEALERMQAREALVTAEHAVTARLVELREREATRPFYVYSHYYVPPDLLTITDAIAVSPLADERPALPVIGWFQIDPDGTVRTPLKPEPSETPAGLEARLVAIARSDAFARLRASIASHEGGSLVARAEPARPIQVPTDPTPHRRSGARATHVTSVAPTRVAAAAPEPSSPLPVYLNLQANILADEIQRAQAGSASSFDRVAQSTQTAFVQQVATRPAGTGPQGSSFSVARVHTAAETASVPERVDTPPSPPGRRPTRRATTPSGSPPTAPSLPSVTGSVEVVYEPIQWVEAGDVLALARVVSSEGAAVAQVAAFDRTALIAWLNEALRGVPSNVSSIVLTTTPSGCVHTRSHASFPPRLRLCVQPTEVSNARMSARRSIVVEQALTGSLLVVVLLALWAVHRFVLRETDLARQQTDFVSAVSHELRTPLTTLVMHSEMLASGMVTDARMPRVYEELEQESRRMARLVDNVLEVSRLDHDNRPLRIASGDLAAFVARVVAEYRAKVPHPRATIVFEGGGAALARFDEDAVDRMVTNLLDNALKYGCGGNAEGATISVSVHSTLDAAELRVRDRGAGIPASERERVFARFHRVNRASDAHQPGTGLGLALVRELATLHGGSARAVGPDDGVGACLVVTFPTGAS